MNKLTVFEDSNDTVAWKPEEARRSVHCSRKTLMEIADKAGAIYRIGRSVYILKEPFVDFLKSEALKQRQEKHTA